MTFNENNRVDVNRTTPSYTVDGAVKNMSEQQTQQEEYIEIVMKSQHRTMKIPMSSIVSMKRITRTTYVTTAKTDMLNEEQEYQPTDEEQEQAYQSLHGHNPIHRAPRRKETQPRAVCVASCCGAKHRRTRNGSCAECRLQQ